MTTRAAWWLCPGRHPCASPSHHLGDVTHNARFDVRGLANVSPSDGREGVLPLGPAIACWPSRMPWRRPNDLSALTAIKTVREYRVLRFAAGQLSPRCSHVLDLGRAQSLRARSRAAVCRGVGCEKRRRTAAAPRPAFAEGTHRAGSPAHAPMGGAQRCPLPHSPGAGSAPLARPATHRGSAAPTIAAVAAKRALNGSIYPLHSALMPAAVMMVHHLSISALC